MQSRDFCFWLQGFFELGDSLNDPEKLGLSPRTVEVIKQHLALVFKHEMGEKECGHDLLPYVPEPPASVPAMPWRVIPTPPPVAPYPHPIWGRITDPNPFPAQSIC